MVFCSPWLRTRAAPAHGHQALGGICRTLRPSAIRKDTLRAPAADRDRTGRPTRAQWGKSVLASLRLLKLLFAPILVCESVALAFPVLGAANVAAVDNGRSSPKGTGKRRRE